MEIFELVKFIWTFHGNFELVSFELVELFYHILNYLFAQYLRFGENPSRNPDTIYNFIIQDAGQFTHLLLWILVSQ